MPFIDEILLTRWGNGKSFQGQYAAYTRCKYTNAVHLRGRVN